MCAVGLGYLGERERRTGDICHALWFVGVETGMALEREETVRYRGRAVIEKSRPDAET
jgi:hypothetical protein